MARDGFRTIGPDGALYDDDLYRKKFGKDPPEIAPFGTIESMTAEDHAQCDKKATVRNNGDLNDRSD
jgi:hypothetical protein